jgi:hypothetical protein
MVREWENASPFGFQWVMNITVVFSLHFPVLINNPPALAVVFARSTS